MGAQEPVQAAGKRGMRVRFGLFELDRAAGQLYRSGDVVKLSPQPMAMLLALLETPGEEVSREELQRRLWPDGTYVDFDVSITSCVRKLRQALGDSAENPLFIRTIPKRGFQFIAPVQLVFPQRDATAPPPPSAVGRPELAALHKQYKPPSNVRLQFLGAAVAMVFVAFAVFWLRGVRHHGASTFAAAWENATLEPLTSYPNDEYYPSVSPDSSRVVFSWQGNDDANIDLYINRMDGSDPVRLMATPGREEYSAWSPDGRWIAFVRDIQNVYIVPAAGGNERKIAETDTYYISWTPDSSAVVVGTRRVPDQDVADFDAVSISTGAKRRLTSPADHIFADEKAAFSPDGKWFAYAQRPSPEKKPELFVRSASGGGSARQLTSFNAQLAGFTWAPDSRALVFSSNHSGTFRLWAANVDGSAPALLAASGENAQNPSMTSDSRIIYERVSRRMNLHRVTTAGGAAASQLVMPSSGLDMHAQLSPDGTKIAFISNRSGNRELWVAAYPNGSPERMTSFGRDGLSPEAPKWSPDGKSLVFAVRETLGFIPPHSSARPSDIYTLSLDTGKLWRVTQWASNQGRPSWSRDGKWIYFSSRRSGDWQIWKVPANSFAGSADLNNHAFRVTTEGGYEAIESADGHWLYFVMSPTDMDLWRVPVLPGSAVSHKPERVIEGEVSAGWWAPTRSGLFFVDMREAVQVHHPWNTLKPVYLVAEGRAPVKVFAIDHRVFSGQPNFSVSLDGSEAVYSQLDLQNIDLVMLERAR